MKRAGGHFSWKLKNVIANGIAGIEARDGDTTREAQAIRIAAMANAHRVRGYARSRSATTLG